MKPIKLLGMAALATFCLRAAQAQSAGKTAGLERLTNIPATSIRALSAVSDSVAWASGTMGYVGKTLDGGITWSWTRIPGAGTLDFRSLTAFDSLHAVTANAGCPATIYQTSDGGRHWKRVFFSRDSAVFIDGMAFGNRDEGIAYGDPVKAPDGTARFLLLRTGDGGRHWRAIPFEKRPVAFAKEASFAASNTGLCAHRSTSDLWMATGGTHARVLVSGDFGKSWHAHPTPLLQGKASTGIFSLAFCDQSHGIAVGGDYSAPDTRLGNAALTRDGGKTWQKPLVNPFGYRSCVLYYSRDTLIATGPTGTDASFDGGYTWQPLNNQGFNVIALAPGGRRVFLAGAEGSLAIFSFSTKYTRKARPFQQPTE